jgi:hypothetical protein
MAPAPEITHASPNSTCIPTIARKSGDVEGTTIPTMIVVSLGMQTQL